MQLIISELTLNDNKSCSRRQYEIELQWFPVSVRCNFLHTRLSQLMGTSDSRRSGATLDHIARKLVSWHLWTSQISLQTCAVWPQHKAFYLDNNCSSDIVGIFTAGLRTYEGCIGHVQMSFGLSQVLSRSCSDICGLWQFRCQYRQNALSTKLPEVSSHL